MKLPALQIIVVLLLTTTTLLWHVTAKAIVDGGFGLAALAVILGSLPVLKRYLD